MADEFEWDARKAATNLAKHRVSFDDARRAFDDFDAVEWRDDRQDYGEDRWIILGAVEGQLLHVVYTLLDDMTVRIISARKATPRERRKYHENET
jgi:uncharacterized DUF497 family protein